MSFLVFGSEYGGKQAAAAFRPLRRALFRLFPVGDGSVYFKTLHSFQIVFRVSGRAKEFNGEGPEFFKKKRIQRQAIYTIDLTIPATRWEDACFEKLKLYTLTGVENCFALLVEEAREAKELVNEDSLRVDFNERIQIVREAVAGDPIFEKI